MRFTGTDGVDSLAGVSHLPDADRGGLQNASPTAGKGRSDVDRGVRAKPSGSPIDSNLLDNLPEADRAEIERTRSVSEASVGSSLLEHLPEADRAEIERERARLPSATTHRADIHNLANHLRGLLEQQLDPSRRLPGTPFAPRSQADIEAIVQQVDATGDPSLLDEVDNFRQTLPLDLQEAYDARLQELRDDDRIVFDYAEGMAPSPGLEELAFRGIATATLNRDDLYERVVNEVNDGTVEITFHPQGVPIGAYHPGHDGEAAGLALPDGGLAISADSTQGILSQGDNLFIHEFAHLTQRVSDSGGGELGQRFPEDFVGEDRVLRAFEEPGFQQFLVDRFFGGHWPTEEDGSRRALIHGGAETFPTLENLFFQFPQQLRAESPDIYDVFARYHGYDPLSQSSRLEDQRADRERDVIYDFFGR